MGCCVKRFVLAFAFVFLLSLNAGASGTTFLGLTLDQGADAPESFVWTTGDVPNGVTPTPVDLTGATAAFNVRAQQSPLATSLLAITPTLGGSAGSITFTVTAAQTLSLPAGQYYYDIFITFPSGTIAKFLAGTFVLR